MWPFKKSRIRDVIQSTKQEIRQSDKQIGVTKTVLREMETRATGGRPTMDLAKVISEGMLLNVRNYQ